MEEFKKQAVRFGTEVVFGEVTSVDLKKRSFQLAVGKDTYTCDSLIVATGATAKLLGLESEMKLMGHGVSACATCDGFFFGRGGTTIPRTRCGSMRCSCMKPA